MSEKVKLPREDFDFLEGERAKNPFWKQKAMLQFLNHEVGLLTCIDFDTLLAALLNGYEVEQTPEDKVREYFEKLQRDGNLKLPHIAVVDTLDCLNIKIDGVNA